MVAIIPRRVALVLLGFAVALVLISVLLRAATWAVSPTPGPLLLLDALFDVDAEANIPAWFSTCLLLLCSAVAWLLAITAARRPGRDRLYWGGLGLIFALLSLDELASLHEHGNWIMELVIEPGGALYYAWVIPGAAAVLLFALVYLRFWLALPPRTRALVLLAGLLFCGGALGVELIGNLLADRYGPTSRENWLTTPFEELLEMMGAILLLYALLDHAARQPALSLRVQHGPSGDSPRPSADPI